MLAGILLGMSIGCLGPWLVQEPMLPMLPPTARELERAKAHLAELEQKHQRFAKLLELRAVSLMEYNAVRAQLAEARVAVELLTLLSIRETEYDAAVKLREQKAISNAEFLRAEVQLEQAKRLLQSLRNQLAPLPGLPKKPPIDL